MKQEQAKRFTEALIQALIQERKARGLSHERLAEKAGISRQAIGKIEAGTSNPTMLTIYKITTAMGIKFADFAKDLEKEI